MKRLKQLLRNKLKSQKGETLSEVLIAVLVSTLGLTLLAGMITSAVNIVQKSKDSFTTYINEENQLVEELNPQNGYVFLSGLVLADEYAYSGGSKIEVFYFTNVVPGSETGTERVIYTYKADKTD